MCAYSADSLQQWHPWTYHGVQGRVIRSRPFLLTAGFLSFQSCSWASRWLGWDFPRKHCALKQLLTNLYHSFHSQELNLSIGLMPLGTPHTQLLLLLLCLIFTGISSNKSLAQLIFSLCLLLRGPNGYQCLLHGSVLTCLSSITLKGNSSLNFAPWEPHLYS